MLVPRAGRAPLDVGGKDFVDGAGLGVDIGTEDFGAVGAGVGGVEAETFAVAIVVFRSPGISYCVVLMVSIQPNGLRANTCLTADRRERPSGQRASSPCGG